MTESANIYYNYKVMEYQWTIGQPVSLKGRGLHSGEEVEVTFAPAQPGTGVRFILKSSSKEVKAAVENVWETKRSTSLRRKDAEIRTVEHVLASLWGLKIDNARVELEGGKELPALDGSALPFVQALRQAGKVRQEVPKKVIKVNEPLGIYEDDGFLVLLPSDKLQITYIAHYSHRLIGLQVVSFEIKEDVFEREIAPARTFGFCEELYSLRKEGLAKGATLDNAILVYKDRFSTPLRFPDEIVRHKILDLLGDLALIGAELKGHIIAFKTGHALNVSFVSKIVNLSKKGKSEFGTGRCEDVRCG